MGDPKVLAQAAKHFEKFFTSEVFADIMDNFASVCELLGVQPGNFTHFYPDLKANLKSCQGMNLFKMLDERTKHPVYQENMQAANTRVTVVGDGPCGLRTAIEAQLLGARVTVIEKRTSFTRNNVLHLWPWVIEDLKSLGAKNFYPRFCTGTMNHISIRRLQCILLKTALVFGVEIFGGVSFALFDFTSMFASNAACHIMEKDGKQLMCGLVGDGLLEPFWPTGTGIARGFLGAFDTVWAMRQFAAGDMSATEIMAEREAILKLLPQTTPENITKDFKNMSIIPTSRYPNLPKHLYSTMQVGHLYNSDKPENADVPRFSLSGFKEVISRAQLKRAGGGGGSLAINTRIQGGQSQESLMKVQQSCDANANDFYQAMREKRKIERESNGGGEDRRGSKTTLQLEAYEAGTKRNAPMQTSSTTKDPGLSYQNAPGATLKEKIALRRAALEKENREKEREEEKGDQKTILNDIASKAEFVRKMSQTFGYGMPSNAEAKPDTLTAEAEKCPLLIKSSNNRNSPRENNRKNSENLPIKKDEPKQ